VKEEGPQNTVFFLGKYSLYPIPLPSLLGYWILVKFMIEKVLIGRGWP
jgi:hypothetical protein